MDAIFSGDGLFGFGGATASSFMIGHFALAAATFAMFAISGGFSIAAIRNAREARDARADAEKHKRSAQDLAVEVRHLTAQVERALARAQAGAAPVERPAALAGGGAMGSNPVRVGAAKDTEEAEIEIIAAETAAE